MTGEEEPFCSGCGSSRHVIWSPVFSAWLCQADLEWRTHNLLKLPPS